MTLDDIDPYFVALDDDAGLIEDYVAAKAARENAEAEVVRLREMILKLLPAEQEAPDGAIGTVGGVARLSYRPQVRQQLNYRKLREQFPSVSITCTDYATTWALRIVSLVEQAEVPPA